MVILYNLLCVSTPLSLSSTSDYGYVRDLHKVDTLKCLPISGFNLSLVCPPGHDTYQQSIHG